MIENKHLARFSQFSKLQSCNNRTTNNDLYARKVLHKQRNVFICIFKHMLWPQCCCHRNQTQNWRQLQEGWRQETALFDSCVLRS